MADVFLPCAMDSRKENSPIFEVKAPCAPLCQGGAGIHDLPSFAFGPTQPRGQVIGERLYITGLAPAMRISDIPDVPDDLKATMVAVAEQRPAFSSEEAEKASAQEVGWAVDPSHPALHAPADATPETAGLDGGRLAVGPVFDTAEIAAARALLGRLTECRLVLIDAGGLRIAHDTVVHPALCIKLSVIGLVTVTRLHHRLIVRRRS